MRARAVVRAQVDEVVSRRALGRKLEVRTEGAVLHHAFAAAVVLQCANAASTETGIAIGRILRVFTFPHPALALGRARRPTEVGPFIAIRTLIITQIGIGDDAVLPALMESGNGERLAFARRQCADLRTGGVEGQAVLAGIHELDLAGILASANKRDPNNDQAHCHNCDSPACSTER